MDENKIQKDEYKGKVLLVDDDPLIIRMYEYRLRHDGYKIELAFDGESAFLKAKKEHPDIILLDLMMPKMNGVETLKFLKKDEETKDIPVIILTNLGDDPAYIGLTEEMGAPQYLIKAETSLKELSEKVYKTIHDGKK